MLTPDQYQRITEQLNRPPRGVEEVIVETNAVPVVLRMRGYIDGAPFPTLYWLSSKTLHKAIAEIETAGWVKKLEDKLQDDTAFLAAYLNDQKKYMASRLHYLRLDDKHALQEKQRFDRFSSLGIGGIANLEKVRCLHMQYAHHLVEGNTIGAFLDKEFQLNTLTIVA